MDRRKMLKLTGAAVAGSSLLGIDAIAAENPQVADAAGEKQAKKKKALMTVIPTRDYYKLTEGAKNIDKDVFFVVTDSYQLQGGI